MNKKLIVSLLFLGMGCIESAAPNGNQSFFPRTPPSPRKQFSSQRVGKNEDGNGPAQLKEFAFLDQWIWTKEEQYIGSPSWHKSDSAEVAAQMNMVAGDVRTQKHWRDKLEKICIEIRIIDTFFLFWKREDFSKKYSHIAKRYETAMMERDADFNDAGTIQNFQNEGGYSLQEIWHCNSKANTVYSELTHYLGLYEEDDEIEDDSE